VVFVKLEDDLYEARVIRAGTRHAGKLEVIEGLDGKEQLVLANSFPLKSQLLISRLGAGCAHE
jgi:cobalt-zinc-cadmium efflux system membrane fusion protein